MDPAIDPAVHSYLDDVAPTHRPLFDRVHALVLGLRPDAKLANDRGTIRLPLGRADDISDDELRGLIGPALGG